MQAESFEFLTIQEVITLTHRSRSSIYSDMSLGLFPRPVKIGRRSVRWRRQDLYAWYESIYPVNSAQLVPSS